MKTCIFIDAENISVSEYESKYKKKIRKFAKNHGLLSEDIEVRAYAVEGGPTSKTWKSGGVSMKMIPGDPKKNKADNQIVKELTDKADKGIICLLVTHDKGLQTRINIELRDVYIFDE